MTPEQAYKIINKILKLDAKEAGIFISLLSYEFINQYEITNKEYLKSLENSLKLLQEENK